MVLVWSDFEIMRYSLRISKHSNARICSINENSFFCMYNHDESVRVCFCHQDAISCQDKSMLRKLLDMSDQIRHWNGSRKQRIRSVDSSPVMSQLNVASGTNKSLGSIPPLLGVSIKSIPEELRLPRTHSVEDMSAYSQAKGRKPLHKICLTVCLICLLMVYQSTKASYACVPTWFFHQLSNQYAINRSFLL